VLGVCRTGRKDNRRGISVHEWTSPRPIVSTSWNTHRYGKQTHIHKAVLYLATPEDFNERLLCLYSPSLRLTLQLTLKTLSGDEPELTIISSSSVRTLPKPVGIQMAANWNQVASQQQLVSPLITGDSGVQETTLCQRWFLRAQSHQTQLLKVQPAKTRRANTAVRLWSGPACATNVHDIFKKKGNSTANTTIDCVNCVSMTSAFSCTSDRAGVSWRSVSI